LIKDTFICPKKIEIEMKEIENESASLALKLSLLSQSIKYIFSKIKLSPSIELANEYFDLLEKIQRILSTLIFKHEIGISDRLYRFVQDFDNLDHYKNYYFKEIKNGKYFF
jgi:hypothetical protein